MKTGSCIHHVEANERTASCVVTCAVRLVRYHFVGVVGLSGYCCGGMNLCSALRFE